MSGEGPCEGFQGPRREGRKRKPRPRGTKSSVPKQCLRTRRTSVPRHGSRRLVAPGLPPYYRRKQFWHSTGRPGVGRNGTCVDVPHCVHFASCISRGPRSLPKLRPPPPPPSRRGGRSFWKQSRHLTGRSPVGLKGTVVLAPQSAQTTSCSSRGARSKPIFFSP